MQNTEKILNGLELVPVLITSTIPKYGREDMSTHDFIAVASSLF